MTHANELRDRVQRAMDETDPRAMRVRLGRSAYAGESLIDLRNRGFDLVPAIVKQTFSQAEYLGLSGEDTYTMLAYRLAALAEERIALLEQTSRTFIEKDRTI